MTAPDAGFARRAGCQGRLSARDRRLMVLAFILAFSVRLAALIGVHREPVGGLEKGYLETTASLAAGHGPLMRTPAAGADTQDVVALMKKLQAGGLTISGDRPYPADPRGWIPATLHPPGYSLLQLALYRASNYTGMIWLMYFVQAAADAVVVLLLYLFTRNRFGSRAAMAAAWIYALLPGPIILTLQWLPDSFSCFFAAAILAAASCASRGHVRYGLITGAVIALASQFRAEFSIWTIIVIAAVGFTTSPLRLKVRFGAAAIAAQFVLLLPWIYWTQRATGRPLLTTSAGGACMYASLGERGDNPWGATLSDQWITTDAVNHGFTSAWSSEADRYYRAVFLSSVRAHPMSFAKLVLVHRLPVALVPPYSARTYDPAGFNLFDYRVKEGLTRWGVIAKYPGRVLRNMWTSMLTALVSLGLLLGMFAALLAHRREWRQMAWIAVPWIVHTSTLCLFKQIEPRNMAPNLIVLVAGSAVWLTLRRPPGARHVRVSAVQAEAAWAGRPSTVGQAAAPPR